MDGDFQTAVIQGCETVNLVLDLDKGALVRCVIGDLKGVEGRVVAVREESRVVIEIEKGLCVVLPRLCVQGVESEVQP